MARELVAADMQHADFALLASSLIESRPELIRIDWMDRFGAVRALERGAFSTTSEAEVLSAAGHRATARDTTAGATLPATAE